jgi:hypothetical protein
VTRKEIYRAVKPLMAKFGLVGISGQEGTPTLQYAWELEVGDGWSMMWKADVIYCHDLKDREHPGDNFRFAVNRKLSEKELAELSSALTDLAKKIDADKDEEA